MGKVVHLADRLRPRGLVNHPTRMTAQPATEADTTEQMPVRLPFNADLDPLRAAGLIVDSWSIGHFVVGLTDEERVALTGMSEEDADLTVRCWQSLKGCS